MSTRRYFLLGTRLFPSLDKTILHYREKPAPREGGMVMSAEEKICPICGKKGNFKGFACTPCQEKIRREALGERQKIKEEAEREIKRHGQGGE